MELFVAVKHIRNELNGMRRPSIRHFQRIVNLPQRNTTGKRYCVTSRGRSVIGKMNFFNKKNKTKPVELAGSTL